MKSKIMFAIIETEECLSFKTGASLHDKSNAAAYGMANRTDPDQTDVGLHCLPMS